jgi:WD40 repeat protein
VYVWTGDGSRLLFTLGSAFPPLAVGYRPVPPPVFSSDSRFVAASTPAGIAIWNVAQGKPVMVLPTGGARVSSLVFSPDGKRLVAATIASTGGSDLRVWDTAMGKELLTVRQALTDVTALSFSADGQRLIGASGKMVICWDGTPLEATP